MDVEGVERATVAALAPREVLEVGGWLAGLEPGVVGRARSAAPLTHEPGHLGGVLEVLAAAYVERGLRPTFRLADSPGLDEVRAELAGRGYVGSQPTLVMIGAPETMLGGAAVGSVRIGARPGEGWRGLFTGEGFDPEDGAARLAALERGGDAVYAEVRAGEAVLAAGVAAFGHGWAGVHGMRTAASHRRQGLAGRILAALAAEIGDRGVARVFLQVEEENAAARTVYDRAGFRLGWRYRYWSPAAAQP